MFPDEVEEESNIPAPDTSAGDEPDDTDGDVSEEQMILDDLKNRAKTLGIKFHPSIGVDKLREKIQEALDDETEQTNETAPVEKSTEDAARQKLKNEQLKLVRVRITNMDPLKKNHQGDLFLTGNALVGTVKRFVPFAVVWHVPQIILNMIQEKEYQMFTTSKNPKGVEVTTARPVKTYAVEILKDLTEQELKELGRVQAMKSGQETD